MRNQVIYAAVGMFTGLVWALPALTSIRAFLTAMALLFMIRLSGKAKSAFFMFMFIGFLTGQFHEERNVTLLKAGEGEWEVTLSAPVRVDGDRLQAVVTTVQAKEKLQLFYRLPSEAQTELERQLTPGTVCRIKGTLERPAKARNRHAFDYRVFLERQHIFWQLEASELSLSSCFSQKKTWKEAVFAWRLKGIDHIKSHFPDNLQPVAAALLFGDRTMTEETVLEAYQRLGIIHLLAISGLHVGLITSLLYYFFLRIGLTKEAARNLLIGILPVYSLLAGGSPPVVRAVLMTLLVLLSFRFQRTFSALDALSISFILVMLYDPYLLYQAGFQLSYLISLSLLLSSSIILLVPSTELGKMAAITAVSQIAGLPVLLYHFFEFSLYSFIANLFFVPFYSLLVLPLLLIIFLLSFVCPAIVMLLEPFAFVFRHIEGFTVEISRWPFAAVTTGRPEEWQLILIACMWACTFVLTEKWKGVKPASTLLFFMLASALVPHLYSIEGEVSFIDVGQGDAVFIQLPFGQGNYLIDTGGLLPFEKEEWQKRKKEFTVGKDILLPYFKSMGVRRLDKLILTHSDYDHIGAAKELFDELEIKELVISPGSEMKPVMRETIKEAAKYHVPVRYGKYLETWQAGAAFFQIVSPADHLYEGNNDSLAVYAVIGGKKWLFAGDMEAEAERELLTRFTLDIDILKVGHHGSRSSTTEEFLSEAAPEEAVISAGRNNRYQHPHGEVVDRLLKHQVRIWRTDQHGEVTFTYRGKEGTFSAVFP